MHIYSISNSFTTTHAKHCAKVLLKSQQLARKTKKPGTTKRHEARQQENTRSNERNSKNLREEMKKIPKVGIVSWVKIDQKWN
jgi:hypothetical protein